MRTLPARLSAYGLQSVGVPGCRLSEGMFAGDYRRRLRGFGVNLRARGEGIPSQANIHSPELFEEAYGGRRPDAYASLLADVIRHGKAGTVVDLGCGLGLFVELAHGWGLDAVGLEGSSYAVKQAHARRGGLDIRVHDLGERLPFEGGAVANVVLNQVIEHVDPVRCEKLVAECFRILSSGGTAFIYSPSRFNLLERREPTHINMLLPSELARMLRHAGFQVVSQPDYGFWFDSRGLRILNIVADVLMRALPHDRFSATANAIARKP